MKKIKNFISIAMFTMLTFFAMNNNANAQEGTLCPEGYLIKTVTLWVGNCEYEAELCYSCPSLTNPEGHVAIVWFKKIPTVPECINNMTTQEIIDNMHLQIRSYIYLRNVLECVPILPPPCGTPGLKKHSFFQSVCWQKTMQPDSTMKYEACASGSNICVVIYEYCWDPVLQIVRANILEHYILGFFDCPFGPEPLDPVIVGQTNSCFRLSTPCDFLE